MYVFFAFISPAAIGIYFLVSTLWRVAQQAFITRSLYRGEESAGVQAQKAMAEMRAQKKAEGGNGTGNGAKAGKADKAPARKATTGAARRGGNGATRAKADASDSRPPAASSAGSSPGAKPHPRSRKKKKRK
jgi:membrane protein insertase Oxa1/YidC/SpoIIIJ